MWVVNKIGKEQVWYEAELIELVKALCKPASNYSTDADAWALGKKYLAKTILDIIEEFER